MKTTRMALGAALISSACATMDAETTPPTTEDLAYVVELPLGFDESIERVTEALKAEQFSVVSRVDLHTIFEKKLGEKVSPHAILGACNSKLAHQAVTTVPEASLMLPCPLTGNTIEEGRTVVPIGNHQTIIAS